MTNAERLAAGWHPITEPIVLQPGEELFWIEDGDWWKLIPKPLDYPWPAVPCFHASASSKVKVTK